MFGSKSKNYESIIAKLRSYMGNPEATEAEIDVYLDGQEPEPNTNSEALQTAQEALEAAQGQVSTLTTERDDFESRLNTVTMEKADVVSQLETANATIATLTAERDNLAGEVVKLRTQVNKIPKPADPQKPQLNEHQAGAFEEVVVETSEIDKFLATKAPNNILRNKN